MNTIRKELLVEASQDTAFKVFTGKMDLWWPRTFHVGATTMTEIVLEPEVNGRWYSKHEDGSEANIGYVLQWEPNGRLVLNWQVNGSFQFDPALTTEVVVQFIPVSDSQTSVIMEHRNLDKLGGGPAVQSMDDGWGMMMNLYKGVADQAA